MTSYGTSELKSQQQQQKVDLSVLNLPTFYRYSGDSKLGKNEAEEHFMLDRWREDDFPELYRIWEKIVDDGQSYPQERTSELEFRNYFLDHSGDAFVVRTFSDDNDKPRTGVNGVVVGAFYIKSNFPGRSSHLANYGLIVDPMFRGKGIANFMVEQCVRLAPLVGPFKALYTNLVYANNVASISACRRFGFVEVGRVPNAGNLKELGFTDAIQFYREV